MLTPAQREYLKTRLLQERARLLDNLRHFDHDTRVRPEDGDNSSYPTHPADLGSDTEEMETDFAIAGRERETLERMDETLHILYDAPERYGRCSECGGEIPFARLELIPWTRQCGVCAEAAEGRQTPVAV